jgi:hypothetical protein
MRKFRAFIKEEMDSRHFGRQEEGNGSTGFLDWRTAQLSRLNPEENTISLFRKEYPAGKGLDLQIKPNMRKCPGVTLSHPMAKNQENVTSRGVSKFATQRICRRKWRDESYRKPDGEDLYRKGKYFFSLQENAISNRKANCNLAPTTDVQDSYFQPDAILSPRQPIAKGGRGGFPCVINMSNVLCGKCEIEACS